MEAMLHFIDGDHGCAGRVPNFDVSKIGSWVAHFLHVNVKVCGLIVKCEVDSNRLERKLRTMPESFGSQMVT